MTVSKHTPRLQDIYNTAQKSRLKKHYTARSFLRIWSYLLKKFLMENFIFFAVEERFAGEKWQLFQKISSLPQQKVFPEESFTCRAILVQTAFFIL